MTDGVEALEAQIAQHDKNVNALIEKNNNLYAMHQRESLASDDDLHQMTMDEMDDLLRQVEAEIRAKNEIRYRLLLLKQGMK